MFNLRKEKLVRLILDRIFAISNRYEADFKKYRLFRKH